MPELEEALWAPKRKTPTKLRLKDILLRMQVGQTLRINHQDAHCMYIHSSYSCSLNDAVYQLDKTGLYSFEQYHEQVGIAVVRRLR